MISPRKHRDRPSPRSPGSPPPVGDTPEPEPDPTPLERFDRSLKQPQQLALLVRLLGQLGEHRCLLISQGRAGGALHFHLRAAGGHWSWASTDPRAAPEVQALLGESVSVVWPELLPFVDESFDRVVVHHLQTHLTHSQGFRREIHRILVPGGITVWTAPNGNPHLPVNLLRRTLGRGEGDSSGETTGKNGAPAPVRRNGPRPAARAPHLGSEDDVPGLRFRQMATLATRSGLIPTARGGCSRFFSELLEWAGTGPGSVLRPLAILDHVIPGIAGYELAISARKPSLPASRHQ